MNPKFLKQYLAKAIRESQGDLQYLVKRMPNRWSTKGQKLLMEKHGTPRQFAKSVIAAIGDISVLEAHAAIRKYHTEWKAA